MYCTFFNVPYMLVMDESDYLFRILYYCCCLCFRWLEQKTEWDRKRWKISRETSRTAAQVMFTLFLLLFTVVGCFQMFTKFFSTVGRSVERGQMSHASGWVRGHQAGGLGYTRHLPKYITGEPDIWPHSVPNPPSDTLTNFSFKWDTFISRCVQCTCVCATVWDPVKAFRAWCASNDSTRV